MDLNQCKGGGGALKIRYSLPKNQVTCLSEIEIKNDKQPKCK